MSELQFTISIIVITLASLIAALVYTFKQKKQIQGLEEKTKWQLSKIRTLTADNETLKPFQKIVDITKEAARIKHEAETFYSHRTKQATDILSAAEDRKVNIEKEIIELNENKDELSNIIGAINRELEGLQDDYELVATGMLDQLYEVDGSEKAKGFLDRNRDTQKKMIKESRATNCALPEEINIDRKKADKAMTQLILRAFNKEVDMLMTKVKWNNKDKIEQKIHDIRNILNKVAQPIGGFIYKAYAETRVRELKWVHTYQEWLQLEREEQRRVKELMREEERARREAEKAIREAEAEERQLHKALIHARKELEAQGLSEEKRLEYEKQLKELQEKLTIAETQHLRAESMAQQTRRGHVYVISNVGSFGENVYKIGMTRRLEPMDRVKELGDASVPFEFDVHAMMYCDDAPTLEKDLHRHFHCHRKNKVNNRKEFFSIELNEIQKAANQFGAEVEFTMAAEAKEFRETLALASQPLTA